MRKRKQSQPQRLSSRESEKQSWNMEMTEEERTHAREQVDMGSASAPPPQEQAENGDFVTFEQEVLISPQNKQKRRKFASSSQFPCVLKNSQQGLFTLGAFTLASSVDYAAVTLNDEGAPPFSVKVDVLTPSPSTTIYSFVFCDPQTNADLIEAESRDLLPHDFLQALVYLAKKEKLVFSLSRGSQPGTICVNTLPTKESLWDGAFDAFRTDLSDTHMRTVVQFFFPELKAHSTRPKPTVTFDLPETVPSLSPSPKRHDFDIHEFYSSIRPPKTDIGIKQPAELVPEITLRPYQLRAVEWMIKRESQITDATRLSCLWTEVPSKDGTVFYYNRYTGGLSVTPFHERIDVPGGILADEMGLGKTLQVLSLVLLNKSASANSGSLPPQEETSTSSMKEESEDEKVDCSCGISEETSKKTKWIQCDECKAWSHLECSPIVDLNSKFYCHRCTSFSREPPVSTKTTLIVCPASILYQWYNEIQTRISPEALRVLIYKGIREHFFTPAKFAQYDIILTTYDVLRTDLYHIESGKQISLRHQRKYKCLPTPLASTHFLRICLDECQMVESPSKAVEMVKQLHAEHRWAVSGTPIHRSLEDLYYLVDFIGLVPFGCKHWWKILVQQPYEHGSPAEREQAVSLFQRVMWRNSKQDILDELQLPTQHEQRVDLQFSPVESYFYNKQHDQCLIDLKVQISKVSRRGLTTRNKAKLQMPLLRLRQACIHPQIANKAMGALQKNTMTMDELLEQLISKAKIEADEGQRQLACAMNGLAAISIIEENVPEAISTYSQILELEKLSGSELDSLQKMHTLYNLEKLLQDTNQDQIVLPSFPDQSIDRAALREQYDKVKSGYARTAQLKVDVALHSFKTAQESVREVASKLNESWFAEACQQMSKDPRLASQFLLKLSDELTNNDKYSNQQTTSILSQFRDLNGLVFVIESTLQKLEKTRKSLIAGLKNVAETPLQEQLARFSTCPKCTKRKTSAQPCLQCATHAIFDEYERLLFSARTTIVQRSADPLLESITSDKMEVETTDGEEDGEGDRQSSKRVTTSRADSEVEQALKLLANFVRNLHSENAQQLSEDAKLQIELFDRHKKEFKASRQLWTTQKDLVYAIDEVDMAITRIRLRVPGEEVTEVEKAFKILPIEVPTVKLKLQTDRSLADINQRKAKGQLKYLRFLQTRDKTFENESCIICLEAIGPHQVMLPCGHVFCEQCISAIMKKARNTIKCPQCRNRVNVNEVSYIMEGLNKRQPPSTESQEHMGMEEGMEQDNAQKGKEESEVIEVKGSFGAKIEAIMRQLLKIVKHDPKAKSLVFSEWADVLEIIGRALAENGITYVKVEGSRQKFQRNLDQFKSDDQVRVLLLPNKIGSNGLNLIEASYVLLVEPALRAGVEEQAVNRVHRIGQTQETWVYRFIIRNTIEERIAVLGKRRYGAGLQELKQQEMLSIEELKDLFQQTDGEGSSSSQSLSLIDEEDQMPVVSSGKEEQDSDPTLPKSRGRERETFWSGSIFYNNTIVPRHRAVVQMECLHSWELKDKGKSIAQEPHIELFGRSVPIIVAQWILNLSSNNPEENPQLIEGILHLQEKVNAIVQGHSESSSNPSKMEE